MLSRPAMPSSSLHAASRSCEGPASAFSPTTWLQILPALRGSAWIEPIKRITPLHRCPTDLLPWLWVSQRGTGDEPCKPLKVLLAALACGSGSGLAVRRPSRPPQSQRRRRSKMYCSSVEQDRRAKVQALAEQLYRQRYDYLLRIARQARRQPRSRRRSRSILVPALLHTALLVPVIDQTVQPRRLRPES